MFRLHACALTALALVALAGCADQTFEGSVSRENLESEVAARYPPQDPDAELSVTCEDGIEAQVDATQICRVALADDENENSFVRVSVTEVVADRTRISTAPFVPAERVAGVILDSLIDDGYLVTEVTCARDLAGELGASVSCVASPVAEGNDGTIAATVTKVAGLQVAFDYELAAAK